ncbi:hypothetical protein HYQ46_006207 [Verticillium longisporum]|nr:hypothetical protein HYQ46_006207 [Verticillium longisporum]
MDSWIASSQDLANSACVSNLLWNLSRAMNDWKNALRGVGASITPLIRVSNASPASPRSVEEVIFLQ